eukprot:TRINITY_DN2224_c0_g1_i2.p1 TRINITY_DN2224_c0_g1~~TRINITY_DN2224_c0_g1_i2.p1  ORF type:complete len:342 (-),score=114.04 TRINITY_DN2224_c0_g1_i2:583-1608(-)
MEQNLSNSYNPFLTDTEMETVEDPFAPSAPPSSVNIYPFPMQPNNVQMNPPPFDPFAPSAPVMSNNNIPPKTKEAELEELLRIQKEAVEKFLKQKENGSSPIKKEPIEQKVPPMEKKIPKDPMEVEKQDLAACPVCNRSFPLQKIEHHVDVCLNGPQEQKNLNQGKQEEDPDSLEAQEEYLRVYLKRKEQEEADRQMALKFMNGAVEIAPKEKKPEDSDDAQLAKQLQMMEEDEYREHKKRKEDNDLKMALDLEREEKLKEEQAKSKKDWEEALRLIKMEAAQENDEKLARLMAEKEELLEKLQNADPVPTQVSIDVKGIQVFFFFKLIESVSRLLAKSSS